MLHKKQASDLLQNLLPTLADSIIHRSQNIIVDLRLVLINPLQRSIPTPVKKILYSLFNFYGTMATYYNYYHT